MLNRLRIMWHVLWGRPTIYRVTLEPFMLRGASANENLYLVENHFIASGYDLDNYEELPVTIDGPHQNREIFVGQEQLPTW